MSEDELNKYKKTFYAQKVQCVGIEIRVKRDKTQVVLTTADEDEITYNLKKNVAVEEENMNLGLKIKEDKKMQVTKDEITEFLPEVFKKIASHLKDNPSIELYVSYSQTALKFDDDVVVYKFFRDSQVSTIYAKEIHNDDVRLEKQFEASKKAEERKKGEKVEIETKEESK